MVMREVPDDAMDLSPKLQVKAGAAQDEHFEARIGDSAALAFRVALGVLRRPEDAEEVAQEAFLRARRAFVSLRNPDSFRPWLVRTVFRLALDRQRQDRRRRHREQRAGRESLVLAGTSEDALAQAEVHGKIMDAIDSLPDKLRLTTLLVAIQGNSLGEAARLLRLPEGTVKSRLHLARRALAERLRCVTAASEKH
jgi:RNA polymerase sigma-70 factor, ECF subfamily